MNKSGIYEQTFKLNFNTNQFGEGGNVIFGDGTYIVTNTPNRIWYKVLIQYITFGLYKAPWQYKLRPLKEPKYIAGIDPYNPNETALEDILITKINDLK